MLDRAVGIAAQRGVLGPSSEHLLLALVDGGRGQASAILREVEIEDATALVDGMPRERLLLATLDSEDRAIDRIVGSGVMGSGPVQDRLARALTRALPGDEQPTGRAERGLIYLDVLIRILTQQFAEHLPPEWSIRGRGRSDGFRVRATAVVVRAREGTRLGAAPNRSS